MFELLGDISFDRVVSYLQSSDCAALTEERSCDLSPEVTRCSFASRLFVLSSEDAMVVRGFDPRTNTLFDVRTTGRLFAVVTFTAVGRRGLFGLIELVVGLIVLPLDNVLFKFKEMLLFS